MKGFKFSHYISRMALNGTSVAVYCNKDQSVYRLVAERGGCKIRSSIEAYLTNEEYEELPYDPYNLMDRFLHTASMCGIYFH
jgi:purine nucleoside permease